MFILMRPHFSITIDLHRLKGKLIFNYLPFLHHLLHLPLGSLERGIDNLAIIFDLWIVFVLFSDLVVNISITVLFDMPLLFLFELPSEKQVLKLGLVSMRWVIEDRLL